MWGEYRHKGEEGNACFALGAPEKTTNKEVKEKASSVPQDQVETGKEVQKAVEPGNLDWELVTAARASLDGCMEAQVEMTILNKKGLFGREAVEARYIVFVKATMIMHVFLKKKGKRETSFCIEKGSADFVGKAGPLGRLFKVQVFVRESTASGMVKNYSTVLASLNLLVSSQGEAEKLEASLNVGEEIPESRRVEEAAILAKVLAKREAEKVRKLGSRAEAHAKRKAKEDARKVKQAERKAKEEARKAKEEEDLVNGIPAKKRWFQRSTVKNDKPSPAAAETSKKSVFGTHALTPSTMKKDPSPVAAGPSPQGKPMTYKKGERVYGEDDGSWYAAIITGAKFLKSGEEGYDIDYEGFEGNEDYSDINKPLSEIAPVLEFEGPRAFRVASRWDEDGEADD